MGNTCKVYLDKLIKFQKWAIRMISNIPLFAKHNILQVNGMYSLELSVFMYKYSINDLPGIFNDYFTKCSDIHRYQTRHVNDLNLTKKEKKKEKKKREKKTLFWSFRPKEWSNSLEQFWGKN